MTDPSINQVPMPDARDKVHKLVTSLVSPIPYASDLISAIVKPPLEKRLQEWLQSIADAILELQENTGNLRIEELSNNDLFITTVMQTTQIAVRNHQKEKLEALRNIVLNSMHSTDPEDDLKLMFIRLVEIFTPSHLMLLKFFNNSKWYVQLGYPLELDDLPSDTLEMWRKLGSISPQLEGELEFSAKIINDLSDNGLVALPKIELNGRDTLALETKVSPDIMTTMGREFLRFIARPEEI